MRTDSNFKAKSLHRMQQLLRATTRLVERTQHMFEVRAFYDGIRSDGMDVGMPVRCAMRWIWYGKGIYIYSFV